MPIEGKLLEIICCPVSKSPLQRLSAEKLERLNELVAGGSLLYVNGDAVTDPLTEALITEDGKVIYPVEDSIPLLLHEKGIGTTQIQDF